jgi:hypothetical protein
MKLHPEAPRITAYVLGELEPEDAAAVERAAAEDPAIQEKIREVREIQLFLKERLAIPTSQLHPRQRENIRRSARQTDTARKVTSTRPWLIPTAAAAVLALATFIMIRRSAEKPEQASGPVPTAQTPAKPAELPAPIVTPPPFPASARQILVPAAASTTLELPVLPGKPNLVAITKPIVEDGKLPPHETVRLDEILNSFSLRLNGTAAIARGGNAPWHPDNRDSGMSAHVATIATEMIACPWQPSATLLLISVRANGQKDCDLKIAFHPNPANITRYRLLGYPPQNATLAGNPPTKLPAGAYTSLAIEITPSNPGTELGSLEWSANETAAPPISLLHRADDEPSDDARFAAVVCTFAQWLAGEQTGAIDPQILAALARETATATLPADRAEFLKLIEKALQL